MADALSIVPASVLRNLADKLYEKRKNAALEIEGIVKQLALAGEHDKIAAVINLLTTEFTYSPQANHRKGGLIGLAAATVGLTTEASQHLEILCMIFDFHMEDLTKHLFLHSILSKLCHLYLIPFLTKTAEFDTMLVKHCITLQSVPDIDMLGFLPDFLDGLFNMLSDSSHEIRQQADSALSEFLQEIKNSPINEFVKLGGDQLVPYYADILGAILPCISDKEEKIRVVARETNEELRAIRADPAEGFDIGAILSIARRCIFFVTWETARELTNEWEATRIEALHWIATLLARHRAEAYHHASSVIQSLGEEDINVKFLVQLDKLIRLLETPIFAYLRLQRITEFAGVVHSFDPKPIQKEHIGEGNERRLTGKHETADINTFQWVLCMSCNSLFFFFFFQKRVLEKRKEKKKNGKG
ncbi:hypothetical protein COCNU_03G009820 [Cocos nucifera]|uniref:Vacuolar protein 14 C-terminal Fig4-binding domain-containing protein n=1 Tax=Cocos nucifera TaxID=13894 RepID=A0A8K0I319_COCNU|nr:hypothetical protein COCNU_03G009820 [Cocos nucifera]